MRMSSWWMLVALGFLAAVGPLPAAEAPRMGAPRAPAGVPLERCRVVAPGTPTVRAAIAELVTALRERGAAVTEMAPADLLDETGLRWRPAAAQAPRETLFLAGSIVTNRALLPLYAAFLDFADAYYPGGDGFEVRTVLDGPARGVDCVVLGGSTEAGTVRAIRRCTEIVAGLKPGDPFPRTLAVELGGDARTGIPAASTQSTATYAGYLYGLTGDPRHAQAARDGFLKPASGEGGGSYPLNDYELEPFLRSWALVCDSGAFSLEEVQAVHQCLLNTLVLSQGEYWRVSNGGSIGSRHQTMGTSAFYAIVRHLLRRGEPDPAAAALLERWRGECTAYFANAATTFHDDMEGIPCYHSIQPVLHYALEEGVAGYLRRPGGPSPLELAILRAYASVDNLGYYCGTGTYEEARPGQVKALILLGYPLAAAACLNGDAGAAWLLRHFPGTGMHTWGLYSGWGAHAFAAGDAVTPQEPRHLLGVVRVPLGEYRYARAPRTADPKQPWQMALPVPYERTFEKLAFRDAFQPEGQYLALEGFQGTGADNTAPFDANAILRYTDAGAVWLIANTERAGNFHRNAVYVSDGETNLPGWAGCELLGEASAGTRAHLVASRLGGYNGSEWTRHILWLRGRAFAVVDRVRFETPGERQVFCTFRTAPAAELRGRAWVARSGEAEFHLLNADGVPMTSRREGPDGAAIPTVLRQVRALKAAAGTAAHFRNLFYASTPGRPRRFSVRALGEAALLVRDEQARALPGLFAVGDVGAKAGPFASDGMAFYVGPEGACVLGGKTLCCADQPVPLGEGMLPAAARAALQAVWQASAAEPRGRPASRVRRGEPAGIDSAGASRSRAARSPAGAQGSPSLGAGGGVGGRGRGRGFGAGSGSRPTRDAGASRCAGGAQGSPSLGAGGGVGGQGRGRGLGLPAWRYAGLEPRRPAVLDPVVTASAPPDAGGLDDLVDGFIPLWTGDASWKSPKALTLTLDLRRPESISAIEWATGLLVSYNTFPDMARFAARKVTVHFSSDGFRKDVRGGEAVFQPGFTLGPLHKGTVFAMGRWRLGGLKERARYVRLVFPPGPVAIRELYVRKAAGTEARFGPSLAGDLDGDGRPEAVVTTDTGELAVLGADGRRRWGQRFLGPVTCLGVGPGTGDGRPGPLLVGTWEARMYAFAPDGRQQWMVDFIGLGGDLAVPFSLTTTLKGPEGRPAIVVGNYARVSFVTPDGKLLSHSGAYGSHQAMALSDGLDLNGDGVEDVLVLNPWSTISVVDGAERRAPRYMYCSRGEALALRRWGDPAAADPAVLVASDNGVGVLRAKSGQFDWQKGLSPLSCVAAADVDGDGREEVVAGKRDGWLLLLGSEGQVRRKVMMGDAVRSVVAGPGRLWVATGTEVRVLDAGLATVGRLPARAQRLEALGSDLLLLLGEDGSVSAIPARPDGG